MQDQTLIAVAAVAATLLGSVGVIGQIIVANKQARLQEATAYREQAVAWRELEADWTRLLLAGHGPEIAINYGVDRALAGVYKIALTEYKTSRLRAMDSMNSGEFANFPEQQQAALHSALWETEQVKWQQLVPYESSVRRILVHLAQLTDLILRGRLSIHAVYDAIGHDIMKHRGALGAVTRFSYDYGGCIAGTNFENNWWRDLTIDEISPRIGWASALESSPGTLDRIDILFDLIAIRAFQVGDAVHSVTGDYLIEKIGDRKILAYCWKVLAKISKRKAVRYVLQASRVRELQMSAPNLFDTVRYSERRIQGLKRAARHAFRYAARPLVSIGDVFRARHGSRDAYNPSRWTPPAIDPSVDGDSQAALDGASSN